MIKTVRLKSEEFSGKLYAIDMVTYVTHEVVLQEVGPSIGHNSWGADNTRHNR